VPLNELGRIFDILREAEAFAKALDDQRRLGKVTLLITRYLWSMWGLDDALATATGLWLSPPPSRTSASRALVTSHPHNPLISLACGHTGTRNCTYQFVPKVMIRVHHILRHVDLLLLIFKS